MKTTQKILDIARSTIDIEASSIKDLKAFIDNGFADAVKIIYKLKGRVVVTGIGKSANIAGKIVATLNSTGTPAIFMHATDALHGDLGMVRKEDVILCISRSGDTPEIKALIPLLKITGVKIIAITGNSASWLAGQSDIVINSAVKREACPNDLAPTSSTTAQLVLGDAIAVCLMHCRGFSRKDFAKNHPGGILGKKLYLRVSDLCAHNAVPSVFPEQDVRAVIMEISSKRLGATAVTENGKITGIITDGDIRRMLEKHSDISDLKAADIMAPAPKTIDKDTLAADALGIMEKHNITQLLVTSDGKYAGVVHLHDILKEGVV